MEPEIIPRSRYVFVYIGLVVLLAATIFASTFDLGVFNTAIAVTIAVAKALLVALFFMHIWGSTQLTRIFAVMGIFWLALLIGLTLTDYLTRLGGG
ncbi:MAG TPA: cytochrome C oxidase subunit IV family protein [Anaerolineales bacterium]|jgi:cytochrome c oxidase subunit 4|nr:cytochrome C oxidase subunit IV family protein [Anaerolineales bacterium]